MHLRSPAQQPHLLAELGLDERVDEHRRPALRTLDGELQILDGLDPRMADLLERLVWELRLERHHEPRCGLAGRVGDDVELDGRLHAREPRGSM